MIHLAWRSLGARAAHIFKYNLLIEEHNLMKVLFTVGILLLLLGAAIIGIAGYQWIHTAPPDCRVGGPGCSIRLPPETKSPA
jgi:hypothetical protein